MNMKKILDIRFLAVFLVTTALLMSSCLKNNKYYVDFANYEPNIELQMAGAKINAPFAFPMDVSFEPQDFLVYVNYAGMDKAPTDITAKLEIDSAYLNEYNGEQDAAAKEKQADYLSKDTANTVNDDDYPADYEPYTLFPDSLYTVDKMEATIPAGQRQGFATVKIITGKMDFQAKYVLPFTISSISPQVKLSNWNHLMINVTAKNEWDGTYLYTATTSLGDADGEKATMVTVGQNSVVMKLVNYYSNEVVFTIDPTTNKVTVSMTSLLPIATDPSSHWDPATKTFHMKWTSGGGNRTYNETYVKQ